ncbi:MULTISPECIES: histidinol-phosphate transaminase [Sphingomonas]|jgi:histidinol-phosphate aminotransferase|uniref:histidinol-phosphate transaminase n=1 Tax=Sphingomonas TaxID=13687 RepID=UPI001AEE4D20|nr:MULTISPECIES: histidinol-phosphate transaminase [Sphingomonas]
MTAPAPKPWILGIAPYVPGRATADDGRRVIKLSSNENPLGTPESARDAYRSAATELERYPDAAAVELRAKIAAHYGIEADRIVYGTGSDEVLHLAAGAFAGVGDEIIHVRYGFAVYEIATRRVGATPVIAPDADYATDVDAILAAVTDRTRVVFVANPNNPTGTYTPRADIARLHAGLRKDILLVLDQAYTEYLESEDDDGGLDLARIEPNVLVTRTFSKIFGLAAERIGWGYAAPAIIDAMHRIRAPFSFGIGAQRAAIAALADTDFVTRSREHNREWRGWFAHAVESIPGLRAVPSKANFVLVTFAGPLRAETAYQALMAAGYATRWLPGQGLPDALRITIGSEEDMRAVVEVLRAEAGKA